AVHHLSRLQGISFAVILVFLIGLIGLLIWGLRKRESLRHLADMAGRRWAAIRRREYQPKKTRDWLTGLFSAADMLLVGGWRGPLLGAALNVTFDMMTLYFLFAAAGHPVSLGVLLTGYGLPLLLGKMAFMIPGGVGVIESTMAGLYTSLGVPNPVTVVVVLVYRILSFWLPLLLGFPLILVLQRKTSRKSKLTTRR
ncbi:MAG: YbhN family protein, partial [Anaerolineaceae bacterium]|nr:YbhN family protein [Anaerolineaceae bacterium]